ncbi:helix-turn-helix domain-containing protein [Streptomyces sp. wa1063]|uniref:helix-turn-helix domain-containing protein n=1 Tax=Streptomyces sp. wa1063 TaxID=1828212 RepID=UPI000BF09776|nr:helix-turn-helix transcriptional regulator [Streptomyces sp. wa1063]
MPRSVPPPAWVIARRRAIGDRIRAARLAAGYTQEQVALRIPMDRATYIRIEQGHSAALVDSLILIADAIGTPLSDLVRDEGGTKSTGQP